MPLSNIRWITCERVGRGADRPGRTGRGTFLAILTSHFSTDFYLPYSDARATFDEFYHTRTPSYPLLNHILCRLYHAAHTPLAPSVRCDSTALSFSRYLFASLLSASVAHCRGAHSALTHRRAYILTVVTSPLTWEDAQSENMDRPGREGRHGTSRTLTLCHFHLSWPQHSLPSRLIASPLLRLCVGGML